jgi:hypothetical protein
MCGAPSKKPTRLLHVNLESFGDRLALLPNAGRCNHGRDGHAVTLKGVDSNGRFLTSPAKEYPPEFSSFIASVFVDFIVRFVEPPSEPVEGTLPDLEEHARFYMPLDPYLDAHATGQFGEDFATSNYLSVAERRKAAKKMRRKAERELYFVEHPAPPDLEHPAPPDQDQAETLEPHGLQTPLSPPHPGLCKSVRNRPAATLAPEVLERVRQNRAIACQRKLAKLQALLALKAPVSLIPNSPPRFGGVLRSVDTTQFVPMQIGRGATVRNKFRYP